MEKSLPTVQVILIMVETAMLHTKKPPGARDGFWGNLCFRKERIYQRWEREWPK